MHNSLAINSYPFHILYKTAAAIAARTAAACLFTSLVDLPLHGGRVVASEREQVGVVPRKSDLGHVAAMTEQGLELGALDHRRVPIELNLAVIVGCGNYLLSVGEWAD